MTVLGCECAKRRRWEVEEALCSHLEVAYGCRHSLEKALMLFGDRDARLVELSKEFSVAMEAERKAEEGSR
jgi:hypothetical protein